jgi:hypothetical protein
MFFLYLHLHASFTFLTIVLPSFVRLPTFACLIVVRPSFVRALKSYFFELTIQHSSYLMIHSFHWDSCHLRMCAHRDLYLPWDV